MRNVYLSYEKIPYLYNINSNELYKMLGKHLKEVEDYRIMQRIRFLSSEISRNEAVFLAKRMNTHECL